MVRPSEVETPSEGNALGAGDAEQTKESPPSTPLKKQGSFTISKQGSIRSNRSADGVISSAVREDENLIKTEIEHSQANPGAISRSSSVISNASQDKGEHKLGRILLSFGYNIKRQRLEVTVHKIA